MAAVDDIRSSIVLRVVVNLLEKGDVQGAVAAMNLDHDAFAKFELAIVNAYNGGGQAFVANLPKMSDPSGNRVVWHFGVRNTPGEAELRRHSAAFVTAATEDIKQAIGESMAEGLAKGQNPTQTALQVIGKVNRVTGKREGGILGLTSQQSDYVDNPRYRLNPDVEPPGARQQLESGDPAMMKAYLKRGRRDKRFDKTILKAIKDGKPLPKEFIDRVVGRYSDGLLKLRGEAVGLNETMNALAKSRHDAMQQQIDAGKAESQDVTKVWHHPAEEHPRLQHIAMDGKSVGFEEQFQMPDGTLMRYPHDPDAPAKHTIFCRCRTEYRFNAIDALIRKRRLAGVQ
ncbi:head morphogenesis protein [Mesorhizobium sp. CN5-321]|uniref:head morphogenesis protein n=1 Tax=Mesorhizobium hunchu TaxID=3157708 RepID=UPI0032B7E7D7